MPEPKNKMVLGSGTRARGSRASAGGAGLGAQNRERFRGNRADGVLIPINCVAIRDTRVL